MGFPEGCMGRHVFIEEKRCGSMDEMTFCRQSWSLKCFRLFYLFNGEDLVVWGLLQGKKWQLGSMKAMAAMIWARSIELKRGQGVQSTMHSLLEDICLASAS